MGPPLGPLLPNTFMCSLEENLEEESKIPNFYKRYVDDTFVIMPNTAEAYAFLDVLNSKHPALKFTMELATQDKLPFLGMNIIKSGTKLETSVYKKPTNTGLLLHFDSHVDHRYKKGLLKTMINRAYKPSSTWKSFIDKCESLNQTFLNLRYPLKLIDAIFNKSINKFISSDTTNEIDTTDKRSDNLPKVLFPLPFIDQKTTADNTRKQLVQSLSHKIGVSLQPVFTSVKIGKILKTSEKKPDIVNRQCVVYSFKCSLCDKDYVGFTNRHLQQRIMEHSSSRSSIGKHMRQQHGLDNPSITENFTVLRKCRNNFDCLLYEMLFIKELKPSLNVQSDSITA